MAVSFVPMLFARNHSTARAASDIITTIADSSDKGKDYHEFIYTSIEKCFREDVVDNIKFGGFAVGPSKNDYSDPCLCATYFGLRALRNLNKHKDYLADNGGRSNLILNLINRCRKNGYYSATGKGEDSIIYSRFVMKIFDEFIPCPQNNIPRLVCNGNGEKGVYALKPGMTPDIYSTCYGLYINNGTSVEYYQETLQLACAF